MVKFIVTLGLLSLGAAHAAESDLNPAEQAYAALAAKVVASSTDCDRQFPQKVKELGLRFEDEKYVFDDASAKKAVALLAGMKVADKAAIVAFAERTLHPDPALRKDKAFGNFFGVIACYSADRLPLIGGLLARPAQKKSAMKFAKAYVNDPMGAVNVSFFRFQVGYLSRLVKDKTLSLPAPAIAELKDIDTQLQEINSKYATKEKAIYDTFHTSEAADAKKSVSSQEMAKLWDPETAKLAEVAPLRSRFLKVLAKVKP